MLDENSVTPDEVEGPPGYQLYWAVGNNDEGQLQALCALRGRVTGTPSTGPTLMIME